MYCRIMVRGYISMLALNYMGFLRTPEQNVALIIKNYEMILLRISIGSLDIYTKVFDTAVKCMHIASYTTIISNFKQSCNSVWLLSVELIIS